MVGNRFFPCLVAVLLAPVAAAQIYQGVDAKGNRLPVFTDRPQAYDGNFVEIEPVEPNTVPGDEAPTDEVGSDGGLSEEAAQVDAMEEAAAAAAAEQRAREVEEELNLLAEQRDVAARGLEEAEQALAEGKDPMEGDRVGNYGSGARLSDEYYRRVEQLERQVDAAQSRLDDIDDRMRNLSLGR